MIGVKGLKCTKERFSFLSFYLSFFKCFKGISCRDMVYNGPNAAALKRLVKPMRRRGRNDLDFKVACSFSMTPGTQRPLLWALHGSFITVSLHTQRRMTHLLAVFMFMICAMVDQVWVSLYLSIKPA